jgi:predicted PurR-regulated permease PerM
MDSIFKNFNAGRANFFLLVFICVIIGGGVLKITSPVVLPLTIAILLAFVLYPMVLVLEKIHIPRMVSISLAVILIVAGLYIFGMVLFSSGRVILSRYPQYENRLTEIYVWLSQYFDLSYNTELSFMQNLWNQIGIRSQIRTLTFSLSSIFVDFLKNALLVVLFVAFLLVEASQFNEKLDMAFNKRSDRIKRMGADVMRQVTRYLAAKFLISLANGVIFAIALGLVGMEFAIVWGVIQFLLNFIPVLGSLAAGVGISLFALIQFWPAPGPIILVVIIVLGTNIILGNIVDPKVIGDNTGISPFVVVASLGIWGWIWGFAGMVLAVPMMVIIRIICENFPFLEPISILLGSRKAVLAKQAALEAARAGAEESQTDRTGA